MTKLARDMSPEERKIALEEITKRKPDLEPMDTSKPAKDMSPQARAEWLAEHKKRFGL